MAQPSINQLKQETPLAAPHGRDAREVSCRLPWWVITLICIEPPPDGFFWWQRYQYLFFAPNHIGGLMPSFST